MKLKRLVPTLLALTLVFPLLTACEPSPTILVIGDSLIAQSGAALKARGEEKGYDVVIRAVNGSTIQERNDDLINLINKHEPVAVAIALGSNNSVDPNYNWPEFEHTLAQNPFDVQVTHMRNILAFSKKCYTWTEPTTNPHRSDTTGISVANVNIFRTIIPKGLRVAWNDKRAQEPAPGTWIAPDGLHVTTVGATIYANMIVDDTISKCRI